MFLCSPQLTKKASKPSIPDLSTMDFSSEAKNSDGKKWNLKLSSWNINGIRAWHEVGTYWGLGVPGLK